MYNREMFVNDIWFVKHKLNDLTKALKCIEEQERQFAPTSFDEDYIGPYIVEAIESVIMDLQRLEKDVAGRP